MKYVRVRPASAGGPCAVAHPESGRLIVPNPATPYAANDPLVREYPWLFVDNDDLAEELAERSGSVSIETATARPGARRGGYRRA